MRYHLRGSRVGIECMYIIGRNSSGGHIGFGLEQERCKIQTREVPKDE